MAVATIVLAADPVAHTADMLAILVREGKPDQRFAALDPLHSVVGCGNSAL